VKGSNNNRQQTTDNNNKNNTTMKQTVNFSHFCDAFTAAGRGDQFSYDGLQALYDYITDLEDETGEEYELDVIALCGDFSEYENLAEFAADYGEEYATIEDIEHETTVIPVDDESFIIQVF
jgi:hypothetical protein